MINQLLLVLLIPCFAWATSPTTAWIDDSGQTSCTEREGTSFTFLRDIYIPPELITHGTDRLLNDIYDRFPCVTRQYTSISVKNSDITENIYTSKDDFLIHQTYENWKYYYDYYYYSYYYYYKPNDIYLCNQSLLYGIKRALTISPAGSFILVLTCGSMTDYNDIKLLNEIYTLLENKQSQVFFLTLLSYCNISDSQEKIFYEIASRSYGQFLWIDYYNSEQVINGLDLFLIKPTNYLRILNVNLNGIDVHSEPFNVEANLSYLLITTSKPIILTLTDPRGENVNFEQTQSYVYGQSYLVKNPNSGTWFLNVTGYENVAVNIMGFRGNCSNILCGQNATCEEFGGNQVCTCKLGYAGNGSLCYEVHDCYDYCGNGYCVTSKGSSSCFCYSGFKYIPGSGCVDIDECASPDLNDCHPLAACSNQQGGYYCSCPSGYFGDGKYCEINECEQGIPCDTKSACVKSRGSYTCTDPCFNHTVLDQQWRSTANTHDWNSYYNDHSWVHCDINLNGWYRFKGAKDQQIPEYCVPELSCGAHSPMWINGVHPTKEEGIVTRTACANWRGDCCLWSNTISVKACPGGYYVYKLARTPTCFLAYCVESNFSCSANDCAPDEECQDINGVSECRCKTDVSIGQPSNNPASVISQECGLNQIKLSFSKCQLERMGYDTSSIHLSNNSCKTINEKGDKSYISIITLPRSGSCGSQLVANETHLTYINTVYLALKSDGIIQRDETRINFSCSYARNMEVNLLMAINPMVTYTDITIGGTAIYSIRMGLFQDSGYSTMYEGSEVWLTTASMLYVGVMADQAKDSKFNLVMKNCYATPTSDSKNPLKYYIIKDNCPNRYDPTINVTQNGGSPEGRFSVQVFTFIGNYSQVYLHCEIRLCDTSYENCVPSCSGVRSASVDEGSPTHILRLGPIRRAESPASSGLSASSTSSPAGAASFVTLLITFFIALLASN
ncbi:uromodulin-like [Discoglossus pictus]